MVKNYLLQCIKCGEVDTQSGSSYEKENIFAITDSQGGITDDSVAEFKSPEDAKPYNNMIHDR